MLDAYACLTDIATGLNPHFHTPNYYTHDCIIARPREWDQESIHGKAYQASETPHFHTSISRYIQNRIVHSKSSLDSSSAPNPNPMCFCYGLFSVPRSCNFTPQKPKSSDTLYRELTLKRQRDRPHGALWRSKYKDKVICWIIIMLSALVNEGRKQQPLVSITATVPHTPLPITGRMPAHALAGGAKHGTTSPHHSRSLEPLHLSLMCARAEALARPEAWGGLFDCASKVDRRLSN